MIEKPSEEDKEIYLKKRTVTQPTNYITSQYSHI